MRLRLFLPIFVLLAMLLGQQAGAVHAISHWQEQTQLCQKSHYKASDNTCERCLAFAGLGGVIPSSRVLLPALPAPSHEISGGCAAFCRPLARAYHARAPPFLAV
jgi:hypothetical protein